MPTRAAGTEYLPSPPVTRISAPGGKVVGRLGIRKTGATNGVKPNMCCPPATNGERAFGKLAPSQPASATKMMKVTPSL